MSSSRQNHIRSVLNDEVLAWTKPFTKAECVERMLKKIMGEEYTEDIHTLLLNLRGAMNESRDGWVKVQQEQEANTDSCYTTEHFEGIQHGFIEAIRLIDKTLNNLGKDG